MLKTINLIQIYNVWFDQKKTMSNILNDIFNIDNNYIVFVP